MRILLVLYGLLIVGCSGRLSCIKDADDAYWQQLTDCKANGVETYGECDAETPHKAALKVCR